MGMISRHEYRGGVWVDLEQPTEEEIREIVQEFSISKQFEKELVSPTPSPLVAAGDDSVLLVLHFPAHGPEDGATVNQEIDFIIGKRFIVTVRYEVVAPLYHLKKLLEAQELVNGKDSITTDVLLEVLFAHLYTAVRDHADHAVDGMARVERDMFDGRERAAVRSISIINREFLHIEALLANQEEPLDRFLKTLVEHGSFGPSFVERGDRIRAERAQVARLITTHRAIAAELRRTNMALLEVRQSEIMKTLTVITVIVLPLELMAFIFGMHLPGTPFEGNPNAFLIVMALMFGAVGLVAVFFARKRWIF